jgi:hypothetical protein
MKKSGKLKNVFEGKFLKITSAIAVKLPVDSQSLVAKSASCLALVLQMLS